MASMNPVNIKAGLIKVKESQHGLGDAAADNLHMRIYNGSAERIQAYSP